MVNVKTDASNQECFCCRVTGVFLKISEPHPCEASVHSLRVSRSWETFPQSFIPEDTHSSTQEKNPTPAVFVEKVSPRKAN